MSEATEDEDLDNDWLDDLTLEEEADVWAEATGVPKELATHLAHHRRGEVTGCLEEDE